MALVLACIITTQAAVRVHSRSVAYGAGERCHPFFGNSSYGPGRVRQGDLQSAVLDCRIVP